MPTRSLAALAAALLFGSSLATAETVPTPRLGRSATAAELQALDLSIGPDGAGLPPGRGSVAEGQAIYAQHCQSCHNERGAGQPADRLTGGIGTLATSAPIKTVASFWPYPTTLFDYIRRAMPIQAPQSLRDEQVYALVAYLLSIDRIVPETSVLDAAGLRAIRMPNREGFVPWPSNR